MFDRRLEIEREALKEAGRFLQWALDLIETTQALEGRDPLHQVTYGRARRTAQEIGKLLNQSG